MPLSDGVGFVSLADPGVDLVDDCLFVGDSPVEALRGEDAEFGFGQVQPGTVFRRVMPFEALDESPGLGGGKSFVERCGGVGVEIIVSVRRRPPCWEGARFEGCDRRASFKVTRRSMGRFSGRAPTALE